MSVGPYARTSATSIAAHSAEAPQSRIPAKRPLFDELRDRASSLLHSKLGIAEQKSAAIVSLIPNSSLEGVERYLQRGVKEADPRASQLRSQLHFGGLFPKGSKSDRLYIRAQVLMAAADNYGQHGSSARAVNAAADRRRTEDVVRGYISTESACYLGQGTGLTAAHTLLG